ncbi:MAG: TRAP transporter large permease subunit [Hyphomicrobiales bacterium]|nr:MAG: TRAP transporter large permease subunit [Hyphomicrobiales bacterium]
MGAASDLNEVLVAVADAAFDLVARATHATVVLRDDDEERDPTPSGKPNLAGYVPIVTRVRGQTGHVGPIPITRSVFRKVITERAAIVAADAPTEMDQTESLMGAQIRSTMGVPFWRGEEIMGVLQLDNRESTGVFTATESSCIAVFYAALVTALVYRQMGWKDFVHATIGAVRTTAMVLLIIGTAAAFSYLMARLSVPALLIDLLNDISSDPLMILLLLNVLMLFLGTFMDMGPMIIITTPIFLPVVQSYGIDPVHFGVIMILNLGIGLNTPPVGAVQFVACAVGKITVWEAMRSIWPFYAASLVVLGLVTYIPEISLWLPRLFKGM